MSCFSTPQLNEVLTWCNDRLGNVALQIVDPNHRTLSKMKLGANFNSFVVCKKCLVVKVSERKSCVVCVTSSVQTVFKGMEEWSCAVSPSIREGKSKCYFFWNKLFHKSVQIKKKFNSLLGSCQLSIYLFICKMVDASLLDVLKESFLCVPECV